MFVFLFRYGRRTILAAGAVSSAVFAIARSFSPNYNVFVLFEFLESLAGSTLYATCFIIGIELVGPKHRVLAVSVITIFYPIGEILLAVAAKYLLDWRILLRVIYIPALIQVLYFWVLPESVRWLLSQGKEEEASNIIRNVAATNKRTVPEHYLDKLLLANRDSLQAAASESQFPIREAFRNLFWRIINCSVCWFTNVLVFYGISLNSVTLGGNKYNNFMLISLVEIPSLLVACLIVDRLGRRYSMFMCMLLSGISSGATIFLKPGGKTIVIVYIQIKNYISF